jgi:hypothetical protein
LLRDFRQGGPAAIAKVRKYQAAAYMKICALMIPKEMKLEHSGGVLKAAMRMQLSVIVWDLETVPDLGGFAAANDLVGKSDVEIRGATMAASLGERGGKLWSAVKRVHALAGLYFDELSDNLEPLSHNKPRKCLPLRL